MGILIFIFYIELKMEERFRNKINIIYNFITNTKDFIVLLYMRCKKCRQQN